MTKHDYKHRFKSGEIIYIEGIKTNGVYIGSNNGHHEFAFWPKGGNKRVPAVAEIPDKTLHITKDKKNVASNHDQRFILAIPHNRDHYSRRDELCSLLKEARL